MEEQQAGFHAEPAGLADRSKLMQRHCEAKAKQQVRYSRRSLCALRDIFN
jgi:hypothetical protein